MRGKELVVAGGGGEGAIRGGNGRIRAKHTYDSETRSRLADEGLTGNVEMSEKHTDEKSCFTVMPNSLLKGFCVNVTNNCCENYVIARL